MQIALCALLQLPKYCLEAIHHFNEKTRACLRHIDGESSIPRTRHITQLNENNKRQRAFFLSIYIHFYTLYAKNNMQRIVLARYTYMYIIWLFWLHFKMSQILNFHPQYAKYFSKFLSQGLRVFFLYIFCMCTSARTQS